LPGYGCDPKKLGPGLCEQISECDGVIDVRSDIGIEQDFDSIVAHSLLLLSKVGIFVAES
jgi:hypothetical protein